jgi:hypothetical protein
MTNPSACPDPGDLQRLLVGQISAPEAEALGQHLLGCGACTKVVASLPIHDPLLAIFRAGRGAVPLNNPVVDALMERLVRIAPDTIAVSTPSASADDTAGTDADSEPMPEHVGRYQIVGRLGSGGMGAVYRGHDPLPCDIRTSAPSMTLARTRAGPTSCWTWSKARAWRHVCTVRDALRIAVQPSS